MVGLELRVTRWVSLLQRNRLHYVSEIFIHCLSLEEDCLPLGYWYKAWPYDFLWPIESSKHCVLFPEGNCKISRHALLWFLFLQQHSWHCSKWGLLSRIEPQPTYNWLVAREEINLCFVRHWDVGIICYCNVNYYIFTDTDREKQTFKQKGKWELSN